MRRRDIIALLGGMALARPLAAEAQQAGKVYRIGFLSQGEPPKAWVEALQQGLRERGYVEGRNLVWEFRSPVETELVPSLARPGGNITGVAVNAAEMSGKRLQLLTELAPALEQFPFAFMHNRRV